MDGGGVFHKLRHLAADEAEDGVNGGQALVARGHRVSALALQMREEVTHKIGRNLLGHHLRRLGAMAFAEKSEEQPQSVPVSLTPLHKRCGLFGVSQLQLHPPMCRFPTDRLPSVRFAALQTVLLAHYDSRQPVPRASFVTSRSVIRLIVCVRS